MRPSIFRDLTVVSLLLCVAVPLTAYSQDKIPKFLLIKLTREQSSTLCHSEVFTQCMAFSKETCLELSEKAIEQCLAPLPEEIDPNYLQNSTLEQCPRQVYEDQGYTEEKAKECFEKSSKAVSD